MWERKWYVKLHWISVSIVLIYIFSILYLYPYQSFIFFANNLYLYLSVPTQDQALQQVVLLKKELAELRAAQAMNSSVPMLGHGGGDISGTTLQEQVNKARGLDPQSKAETEIERSAHRETMEALELSEATVSVFNYFFYITYLIIGLSHLFILMIFTYNDNWKNHYFACCTRATIHNNLMHYIKNVPNHFLFQYLTLLRAIACVLEMDEIGGLRSMAHIPKDERQRLFGERETATEMLSSRIKV